MAVLNSAYYTAIQAGRTPLGVSWPGCAKTASITAFAKATNRKLYVLIGSIREPSDFGIPFLQDSTTIATGVNDDPEHGIAHFVLAAPKWAADTWDGDKWLVCLDELTSCPPAVQAGMLRFIAENYVGDLEMPDNLWKCALANPTEIATNGFEIEPAMANRMVHLPWEMDWETWDDGMEKGGNFTAPKFPIVPKGWEKEKPLVGQMFRLFRKHRPNACRPDTDLHGSVTMSRESLSRAWPSPRSWEIAMDCRAAGIAAGVDKGVLAELLDGCVGPVGKEYTEWEANLDLPDPEVAVNGAVTAMQRGNGMEVPYTPLHRADQTMAFLHSVVHHVIGDPLNKQRFTAERWHAATYLFAKAAEHEAEIASACLASMTRRKGESKDCSPPGTEIPDDVASVVYTMSTAMLDQRKDKVK